jgi:hypothetical protein
MLYDAIAFEDLGEGCKRAPTVHHKILRDDLEPVDHGLLFKDVLIVRDAEADTDSVIF